MSFLASQAMPMTVTHSKGAKRSLHQNALAAKWYAQIAEEVGDSPAAIKATCKRTHGLPIMEAERLDWVQEWEPLYGPLGYEPQCKLFECIPMTRLFTTRQMAAYMTAVQREYVQQGVPLVDPEARKYEQEFQA